MSSPNDPILSKAGLIGDRETTITTFLTSFEKSLATGSSFGPPALHFQGIGQSSAKEIAEKMALPSSDGWKSIFIDTIITGIGGSINLPGNTSLFPVFDVTSLLPEAKIPFPINKPDPVNLTNWVFSSVLELEEIETFTLTPPDPRIAQATVILTEKLATSGIQIPPPLPKIPQVPVFDIPSLPGYGSIPTLPTDFFAPELLKGVLGIPVAIFTQYFTSIEKMTDLISNIANFPKMIVDEITNLIIKIPVVDKLLKQDPKPISFVGSILQIIKFISSTVAATLIGSIMGAGSLTTTVSNLVSNLF